MRISDDPQHALEESNYVSYIPSKEAESILGISHSSIAYHAKVGNLQSAKIGGRTWYRELDVYRLKAEGYGKKVKK